MSHFRIADSLLPQARRPGRLCRLLTSARLSPIVPQLALSRVLLPMGLVLLVVVSGSGCGPQDKISSYTVPKTPTVERVAQRTLAAMVPHQDQAWFFKVTGPAAQVEAVTEPFRQLVTSVAFDPAGGPQPQWTLPEGWSRQPGSEMRFATIQIPAEGQGASEGPSAAASKPLELTVIALPMAEGDSAEYRLSNVNRWRNQLGLPPLGPQQLKDDVEELSLAGGGSAMLVNLLGEGSGVGGPPMASMPMAPSGAGPGPGPGPGSGSGSGEPAGPSPSFTYDTPSGWEAGRVGGFRKAAFTVQDGDQQLEITVIDLAAAAGEVLPNVNRWRGQVDLPDMTQQELDKNLVKLTIDGQPAVYVELPGPAESERPRTILGAIQVRGEQSWFFKLIGDSALAERERERFQAFLQSIRFNAE